MESNNQADSKQADVSILNLKWLSGEVNKNFNVDGIIRFIEDINLGVKELNAKQ